MVDIYEPIKDYESLAKPEIDSYINETVDKIVKETKIDIEENQKTVKSYDEECGIVNNIQKRINKLKGLRGFLIFLTILSLAAAGVSIYLTATEFSGFNTKILIQIVIAIVGIGLAVLFLVLIFTKINKKVNNAEGEKAKHQSLANEYFAMAQSQMAPVNAMLVEEIPFELIEKTIPIKFNKSFTGSENDYFVQCYGLSKTPSKTTSSLEVLSGQLFDSPFLIEKTYNQDFTTARYEGSLEIYWEEVVENSDGSVSVVQHSQVLRATVEKPVPDYWVGSLLHYGNSAAPELSFSREPQFSHQLTEKQLEKKIKKGSKQLHKLSEKSIRKGGDFTVMVNDRFDVLFNAIDRTNEVQFNFLFTPVAQESMVEILTDKRYCGDTFYYVKNKKLNSLISKQTSEFKLYPKVKKVHSHDFEYTKNAFINLCHSYFKSLYFMFAPILAIPAYKQEMPESRNDVNYTGTCCSLFEAESLANCFKDEVWEHQDTATNLILTCRYAYNVGKSDCYSVLANSFGVEQRVDYVSVYGDDGSYHNVPVPWNYYFPLEKGSLLFVRNLDMTETEYMEKFSEKTLQRLIDAFGSCYVFDKGYLAFAVNSGASLELFNKIFEEEI